jgi:hypothetical protein
VDDTHRRVLDTPSVLEDAEFYESTVIVEYLLNDTRVSIIYSPRLFPKLFSLCANLLQRAGH